MIRLTDYKNFYKDYICDILLFIQYIKLCIKQLLKKNYFLLSLINKITTPPIAAITPITNKLI